MSWSSGSHLLLAATPRSGDRGAASGTIVLDSLPALTHASATISSAYAPAFSYRRRWRTHSSGEHNARPGLEHGPPSVVLRADLHIMRCPVHLQNDDTAVRVSEGSHLLAAIQ